MRAMSQTDRPELPVESAPGGLAVGIDIVKISRITQSLSRFGNRFLQRIFTPHEISYAMSAPALSAERLAARFAAKESAIKALRLADRGIRWTDLEVWRSAAGECELRLHGAAKAVAQNNGICAVALSLSHEDEYAVAIVIATPSPIS